MMRLCIALFLCASVAWGQSLTGKENGLVALYRCDATGEVNLVSGGNMLYQASANPGWATNFPAAIGATSLRSASSGNGTCSYGMTSSSTLLNGATAYTIAFWVNMESSVSFAGLVYSSGTGNKYFGLDTATAAQGTTINMYHNSATTPVAVAALKTNQWVHIAGVVDTVTKTTSIYVNGMFAASSTNTGLALQQDDDIKIGLDDANSARLFNGHFDDVAVFNVACSPAVIRALAANKPPPVNGGNSYQYQNRYGVSK